MSGLNYTNLNDVPSTINPVFNQQSPMVYNAREIPSGNSAANPYQYNQTPPPTMEQFQGGSLPVMTPPQPSYPTAPPQAPKQVAPKKKKRVQLDLDATFYKIFGSSYLSILFHLVVLGIAGWVSYNLYNNPKLRTMDVLLLLAVVLALLVRIQQTINIYYPDGETN